MSFVNSNINVVKIKTNATFELISTTLSEINLLNSGTSQYKKINIWNISSKNYYVCLFAINNGKHGNINKFDLPPPVDKSFFYDDIILIKTTMYGDPTSYTIDEWKNDYAELYGGFEDIISDEDYSSDSEYSMDDYEKTKEGYIIDDFIVDDEEDIYNNQNTPHESKFEAIIDDDSDYDSL